VTSVDAVLPLYSRHQSIATQHSSDTVSSSCHTRHQSNNNNQHKTETCL